MIRRDNSGVLPACLGLAVGLWLAFHPVFTSGLRLGHGSGNDSRLVAYLLEHAHLFLLQAPGHERFWDAPFFYPARNAIAFSDTLLGFVPLYSPWRLLGLAPDLAFQLFLLVAWSANYLAFWLFLRRIFGLSPAAAAMGAFLFAFSAPRLVNAGHPQLAPQFFLVAALYALFRLVELARRGDGGRAFAGWAAVFATALASQAYAAFYPFFFFGLTLGLALVVALAQPAGRQGLWALARCRPAVLCCAILYAALLIMPLARHYLSAAEEVGTRSWEEVEPNLPRWASWLAMGKGSWLYGWIVETAPVQTHLPYLDHYTHHNGIGAATLALALGGLYLGRRRTGVRLLAATAVLTVLVTTVFAPGITLWRLVFELVPGADGLRAITRVAHQLLPVAGLGLACAFEALLEHRRHLLGAVLAGFCALEQGVAISTFDLDQARLRVAAIVHRVEPTCQAFFLGSLDRRARLPMHVDAMWAALASGVPTINGYSGAAPPGWGLSNIRKERRHLQRSDLEAEVCRWVLSRDLDPARTCWLEVEREDRGKEAPLVWSAARLECSR